MGIAAICVRVWTPRLSASPLLLTDVRYQVVVCIDNALELNVKIWDGPQLQVEGSLSNMRTANLSGEPSRRFHLFVALVSSAESKLASIP